MELQMAVGNGNGGEMKLIACVTTLFLLNVARAFTVLRRNSLGDIFNDNAVDVSFFLLYLVVTEICKIAQTLDVT